MPPLAAFVIPLLVPIAPPRLDADGIPLPAEAVRRLGSARFRHAFVPSALVVTPDGRTVITLDDHSTGQLLRGWDARTGHPLFRVPTRAECIYGQRLVLDRAGLRIEEPGPKGRFHILWFDPHTGSRLGPPVLYPPTAGRQSRLSPDGKTFVAHHGDVVRRYGIDETDHTLTLYPADGRPITIFKETDKSDRSELDVIFSPDGRRLAVVRDSSGPPAVRVFDAQTGKLIRKLTAEGEFVHPAVFSPDGSRVAAVVVGKAQNTLVEWEVATGRRRDVVKDPRRGLFHRPIYSPDGRWVATHDLGSDEWELVIWDAATGRARHRFRNVGPLVAFSPDGKSLFAQQGSGAVSSTVGRYDLDTGRIHAPELPYCIHLMRYTAGGQVLVSEYGEERRVQLIGLDVRSGKVVFRGHKFNPPSPKSVVSILDASPDGRWVTLREYIQDGGGMWGFGRFASSFRICDAATGAVRATCSGHTNGTLDMKFSSDGTRVYSYSGSEHRASRSKLERRAWDAATGRRLDDPAAETFVFDLVASPDGRMSAKAEETDEAIAFGDLGVMLVERVTGQVRHTFRGHIGVNLGFAFSPDGRYLAAASPDAPIFIWDIRGELSKPATPPDDRTINTAWADLASDDAAKAFDAIRLLAHFPERSLPLLREKLRPVAGPTADAVARLVADLDAPAFADREKAERELKKLGRLAGPALREAAKTSTSAELRQRAGRLLAPLDAGKLSAEQLRAIRAVEAVEWMDTPAAKALLREWATGAAGATLTVEASAAVKK